MGNEKLKATQKDAAAIGDETTYQPVDLTRLPPKIQLADNNIWVTVLESPCSFTPEIFDAVMLNLIKNPNLTSSHLFRGDILYDDNSLDGDPAGSIGHFKHLDTEHPPRRTSIEGFTQRRTIVRRLIPRNPQLDKALIQTCQFFQRIRSGEEQNLVLYVPHVDQPTDMPFYHPPVAKVAFHHIWHHVGDGSIANDHHSRGTVSLSYAFFPPTKALSPKLERTALKLHQTIYKHGQGQLAGFTKRVHLDRLIPQKRYQDTYTRLKAQYGRRLSEQWIEVTDPGKHVFEDIGIAAFLIELWTEMYQMPPGTMSPQFDDDRDTDEGHRHNTTTTTSPSSSSSTSSHVKPYFPGFVDIGCGNGVLVYILLSEGYHGWGFDARRRKTWSIFPDEIQARLQQRLLVPKIFQTGGQIAKAAEAGWHDGVFDPGTFIVSNHADELTAWTPLLAYQNDSFFIAIPCCSHDLTGARFRAPATTRTPTQAPPRLPQQDVSTVKPGPAIGKHVAETGSLKRTDAQKKMPSAYSTLCSYVTALAQEVNYEPETEVLRIPSTRNRCIVGRKWRQVSPSSTDQGAREQVIVTILEQELGKPVKMLGKEWIERAMKRSEKPGSGH